MIETVMTYKEWKKLHRKRIMEEIKFTVILFLLFMSIMAGMWFLAGL